MPPKGAAQINDESEEREYTSQLLHPSATTLGELCTSEEWSVGRAPRNSSRGGGVYGRDGATVRRSPPLECAIRLTSLPSANSRESRLGLRLRTESAAKALEQNADVRALFPLPSPFPFVTYITQQLRQHCGNGDLDARILGKRCHFVYPARSHRHAV